MLFQIEILKKTIRFILVIWKKKTHYIKKVEMIKQYKDGGLQAIDFDYINGTLKINWLKSFLNNTKLWFHIPRELFKKLGGI